MAEVSKEQTATQVRAGRPGSGAVPVRKGWRFVCAREHAGEHGKGALQRDGGWGLTRSCSLRPPAAGAWKKRGVPGAPDEYLPTACGSQACERVAAAEVGVRGGVAAWARVHMLHR